jgi:hypothetical protein
MKSIAELVDLIAAWGSAREALHRGEKCPFLLSCRPAPAPKNVVSDLNVGSDLRAFWLASDGADIFKDETYGQWGLRVLPPAEIKDSTCRERIRSPNDVYESDFVVGEFYGDSDQLLIDASKADQGEFPVVVKLPIDGRNAWPRVAESFGEFLERYVAAEGDKFWEP